MIKKLSKSNDRTLAYKVSGVITKEDYEMLVPEVEAVIEENESANLLLDITDFEREEISAWGKDLKFGKEFHKKIERMAIVGDKKWQKFLAQLSKPFFAKDTKFFPVEEVDDAWQWLAEGE